MSSTTAEERAADALEQGIAYVFRGLIEIALKKLRRSAALSAAPEPYVWLGFICFVNTELARGDALCQEGLAAFPDDGALHACAAILRTGLRDWDSALAELARAEELAPESFFTRFARGFHHVESRDPQAALPHYERALTCGDERTAAFAHLELGRCHFFISKETLSPYHLVACVKSFRNAIAARPDWHFAYCVALMYTERHPDPRIPLAIAEEGYARFPESRAIMLYALRPLLKENRLADAANAYAAAVSHFRHDVDAMIHIAHVAIGYDELRDYAIHALETAERYTPNTTKVARAFIILYTKLGEAEECEAWRARLAERSG